MLGAWLLFVATSRLPCMPFELDAVPMPSVQMPPMSTAPRAAPPVNPPPLPPPLAMLERARYRVEFGWLGQVGEIDVSIRGDRAEGAERLVQVVGQGEGAVFGLGRIRATVDGDFSPARLGSRRWTTARWKSGETITDVVDQPSPGLLNLSRRRDGVATETDQARSLFATFDPLGFVMRVRIAPPAVGQSQIVQVMEGKALWRVTLATAGVQQLPGSPTRQRALRIDGRADPIIYDGRRDDRDRPHRTFTMWLSDDPARVPLRLSMPVGIGDVVVQLVDLQRQKRPTP
jgi:hypothetical protein